MDIQIAPLVRDMNLEDRLSYLDWLLQEIFYTLIKSPFDKYKTRMDTLRNINTSWLKDSHGEMKEMKHISQKKAELIEVIKQMKNEIIQLTPEEFYLEFLKLQRLDNTWRQYKEIFHAELQAGILNKLKNSSVDENITQEYSVILPPQQRIVGRQKNNAAKCTLEKYRVRKNETLSTSMNTT